MSALARARPRLRVFHPRVVRGSVGNGQVVVGHDALASTARPQSHPFSRQARCEPSSLTSVLTGISGKTRVPRMRDEASPQSPTSPSGTLNADRSIELKGERGTGLSASAGGSLPVRSIPANSDGMRVAGTRASGGWNDSAACRKDDARRWPERQGARSDARAPGAAPVMALEATHQETLQQEFSQVTTHASAGMSPQGGGGMSNDIPSTLGVFRYLSDRDRAILVALFEHKVLLTRQLRTMLFRSQRRCQACLRDLAERDLIRSFPPPRWNMKGKPPGHWKLTELGVEIVAAIKRIPVWELSRKPSSDDTRLDHRIAVNEFFCALVDASLDKEGHGLHSWTPERMVRLPDGWIRPDGSGRYLHPGGACDFYLELDRGTETVNQLADKLAGYIAVAKNWTELGPVGFPNLLILVPDFNRERAVVKALSEARGRFKASRKLHGLPFFVSSEDLFYGRGVLEQVWAPMPRLKERLSIVELLAQTGIDYSLSDCLGQRWIGKTNTTRRHPVLARYPSGKPPVGRQGSRRPRNVTPPRYEKGSSKHTRDEEQ